jgi:hypothetical protein
MSSHRLIEKVEVRTFATIFVAMKASLTSGFSLVRFDASSALDTGRLEDGWRS